MYYVPYTYPYAYPSYRYVPIVPYVNAHPHYNNYVDRSLTNTRIADQGPNPFVINIEQATENNTLFRTALWTGEHMQLTLMRIPIGEDIGLEMHEDTDQFLRIEDGDGIVEMGSTKNNLTFRRPLSEDIITIIPAGTWHNITNTGDEPLKLYSIYAPPEHPHSTVHPTKADALAAESHSSS